MIMYHVFQRVQEDWCPHRFRLSQSIYFCATVSRCCPTTAVSMRSGSPNRESSPTLGYFGCRYFSTKSCSTKRGISTPSSDTESTCTLPCPLTPYASAVTTTSCTPLKSESRGLEEFFPALSRSKSTRDVAVTTPGWPWNVTDRTPAGRLIFPAAKYALISCSVNSDGV